ncbi:hypothetical protein ACJX0J_023597, partial [Zea mays]
MGTRASHIYSGRRRLADIYNRIVLLFLQKKNTILIWSPICITLFFTLLAVPLTFNNMSGANPTTAAGDPPPLANVESGVSDKNGAKNQFNELHYLHRLTSLIIDAIFMLLILNFLIVVAIYFLFKIIMFQIMQRAN